MKTDVNEEEELVKSLHKSRVSGGRGWELISAITHDRVTEAATKQRTNAMPLKDAQCVSWV